MITGKTQLAGVIGDPVRHSLSPALHNAAFAAVGLDWVFVAFPVRVENLSGAMAGIRALDVKGLSVTMPHKNPIAVHLDELSPVAARLEAVNTVVSRGGKLVGDNTDGAGFLDWLAEECRFDVAGRHCVVLGAGGAARAVVLALAEAGAARVSVVNRTATAATRAAELAGAAGRVGGSEDVAGADLIVNATPIGMSGTDEAMLPVQAKDLGQGQIVVDLVYYPAETALTRLALRQGAQAHNGVGMLVYQAAKAFEMWTGYPAPLAVMADVARSQTRN